MAKPIADTIHTEPILALSTTRIETTFRGSRRKIFSSSEIGRFIDQNSDAWLVTTPNGKGKPPSNRKGHLIPINSDGQTTILNALLQHTKLKRVGMPFPYRTETRFTWGDAPTYELIQSLDTNGYFSHYTAMHLHGLTDQIPKTIYFNVEQPASAGGGTLSQQGIDRAFRGKCRVSNNVITFRDFRICRLNGGNTHQLGVVDFKTDDGEKIRITDIERTLIDAVVRPIYAGGIGEVAAAFREAAGRISVKKLADYLRKLNFTYPYHQAIGFYLEHDGKYTAADIKRMQRIPIEYDFYLNYQLKNPAHNEKWRLFTPQRF
jgi:AbiEi antitoxin C-terminal domain